MENKLELSVSKQQLDKLQKVEFEKTTIFATLNAIGGVVALKPVVENLGLSWPAQQRVIKNDHKLNQLLLSYPSVGMDGKVRDMLCMKHDDFNDWLWDLNPKSKNFKTKLWEKYKKDLVIFLLSVWKFTLDQVKEMKFETDYVQIIRETQQKIDDLDEKINEKSSELSELKKEHKKLSGYLKQLLRNNPNQLRLNI